MLDPANLSLVATSIGILVSVAGLVKTVFESLKLGSELVQSASGESSSSKRDTARRDVPRLVFNLSLAALLGGVISALSQPVIDAIHPKPDLRICGSSTVAARLAPELVKAFFRAHRYDPKEEPGPESDSVLIVAHPNSSVSSPRIKRVLISGRDTTEGISELLGGKCDIAFASREVNESEWRQFLDAGLGDIKAKGAEFSLGLDEIVVAANSQSLKGRLKELSPSALCQLFTDDHELSWQHLAGGSAEAPLPSESAWRFIRESGSGTGQTFNNKLLRERLRCSGAPLGAPKPEAKIEEAKSNEAMFDRIGEKPFSVGFLSKSFLKNADVYQVPIVSREAGSIVTEMLTRQVLMYLPASRSKSLDHVLAQTFAAFASTQADDTIRNAGFQPNDREPSAATVAQAMPECVADPNEYVIQDRVHFGFDSDEPLAGEIQNLVSTLALELKVRGRRIKLLGFTDSVGSTEANARIAKRRALRVAEELRKRGFKVAQEDILGLGLRFGDPRDVSVQAGNRCVEVHLEPDLAPNGDGS